MTRTAEQCRQQRQTELWIITRHRIAQILDEAANGDIVAWEDLPGLTEDEFGYVLDVIGFASEHYRADVDRWAAAVGRDRLSEILDEAETAPGNQIAQQIARGARMADEGES